MNERLNLWLTKLKNHKDEQAINIF